MVGRRVPSRARQLEERLDARRGRDDLRLGRAPATHRDDDDPTGGRETARDMPGHRGLADALAGADHRERRQPNRLEPGRLEAEVGALVRDAEREHAACERKSLGRRQHRLVGEVEHHVRAVLEHRRLDGGLERHAVVLSAAQLLDAADEHRGDDEVVELFERLTDDGRIVLAVDDRDRAPHPLVVTSRSILPVYFSYSNVSVENWMIRSSPWKG